MKKLIPKILDRIKNGLKSWSVIVLLILFLILSVFLTIKGVLHLFNLSDYFILLTVFVLAMIIVFTIDSVFRIARIELEKSQVNGMLMSMNDAVLAYDENFKIILVNRALELLCNVKKEDIIDKIITPEWNVNPKYSLLSKIVFPSLAPKMYRLSTTTNPTKVVVQLSSPREYILEIATTKVNNDYNNTFGFIKIIKDRTREEQLIKTKSDFITVAAHQLRTPLTGITWGTEMIYKNELGAVNDQQKKILKESLDALYDMSKTVDDLLRAASIEEGRFGYNFELGNIVNLINDVLKNSLIKCQKNNIKLVFYPVDFNIPSFVFDKEKISVVVNNLIDNAIKYNVVNGEVRIKIEPVAGKPFIKIVVSDTGIGINEKDLPRIFEKFYRSPSIMKSHTSGIGLGMYISKNIVNNHGGEIKVESIEKRGTTFSFTLPLDQSYIPPQGTAGLNIV